MAVCKVLKFYMVSKIPGNSNFRTYILWCKLTFWSCLGFGNSKEKMRKMSSWSSHQGANGDKFFYLIQLTRHRKELDEQRHKVFATRNFLNQNLWTMFLPTTYIFQSFHLFNFLTKQIFLYLLVTLNFYFHQFFYIYPRTRDV